MEVKNLKLMTWDDWANSLQVIALIISTIALVILGATTFVTYKSNKEKDDKAKQQEERVAQLTLEAAKANEGVATANSEIEKSKEETAKANAAALQAQEGLGEANKEIARLNLETETAKKERSEADKQIAIAKENAAEANKQTVAISLKVEEEGRKRAEAEVALLELQNRVKFRTLSDEQKLKLLQVLSNQPKGKTQVTFPITDVEAQSYSVQFAEILEKSGWTVERNATSFGYIIREIIVVVRDEKNPFARELQDALKQIGITARIEVINEGSDDYLNLIVGSKP